MMVLVWLLWNKETRTVREARRVAEEPSLEVGKV